MKRTLVAIIFLAISIDSTIAAAQSSEKIIEAAVADARRIDADRERDKTSRPVSVLSFFGAKPGMHVLDLFSGGGYYAEILSYVVGSNGRVVSHNSDLYENYLATEITERYRDSRLSNVERLTSNAPDLKLGDDVFDMILMVMTYHDIYYVSEKDPHHPKVDRDRFFAQVRRSLKPSGILAVIDHSAKPGTGKEAAQELHRIDEAFAKRDIESAGFIFDGKLDALRNSDDDRTMQVFDDRIRRKTDRFVYRFLKAKDDD